MCDHCVNGFGVEDNIVVFVSGHFGFEEKVISEKRFNNDTLCFCLKSVIIH